MFAVTHAASAILIAEKISNPWWIFIIGIISHYFLDLIPHGDRMLEEGIEIDGEPKKRAIKRLAYVTLVDLLITAAYIIYLFYLNIFSNPFNTALAIFAVLLPDMLMGIGKIIYVFNLNASKNILIRINSKLYKIHFFIHDLIPSKMSVWTGVVLQIFLTLLFLYLAKLL